MSVNFTSNGQISEEEPAGNEWFLGGAWSFAHDVQVWGVEAQCSCRKTVSHKVDPQQLDRDQSLGQTKGSREEDTEEEEQFSVSVMVKNCFSFKPRCKSDANQNVFTCSNELLQDITVKKKLSYASTSQIGGTRRDARGGVRGFQWYMAHRT